MINKTSLFPLLLLLLAALQYSIGFVSINLRMKITIIKRLKLFVMVLLVGAGQAQIHGPSNYAPNPDMADFSIFFALATLEIKLIYETGISNAFAEAAAPVQQYYMRVDAQFRDWWTSKGRPPILTDFVIPILNNLQCHLEAHHLRSRQIDHIFQTYHFIPSIHAPCIFHARTIIKENVSFLCQVDDFAIATNHEQHYTQICDSIDTNYIQKIKYSLCDRLQHPASCLFSHGHDENSGNLYEN